MNKNAEYWEKRIANATWKTYNDLESKTRDFLEMYQEASLEISEELYRVAEKMRTSTPTLSDMHKLNRLSKLKKNIENELRALTEKIESLANDNMEQGFKEVYSNINIKLGNTEFAEVPKRVIEQLLRQPWEGSNFSERLWKNSQILAINLNDILTRGLIQGMTVTEMAIQLNNRMNQGFNVAHRLVRTETMHCLNSSALRTYKDAGIKEVQFWAAEDERTCKICGAMHGNKYEVDKAPTPPIHPNCRCTILPIIIEEDEKANDAEFKDEAKNSAPKEGKALNKFGNEIYFDIDKMKPESQKTVKETITELASKYNTRLIGVTDEAGKRGVKGSVGLDFKMNLSTTQKSTVVHEFAHSLSTTRADKLGLTDDKEFWKEIKKVRTQYNKAIRSGASRQISSYADESIDEFMAEAFTHSYLKNTGELEWGYGKDFEYSDKVIKVIDKYFKK